MKRPLLLITLAILSYSAFAQTLVWAKSMGGAASDDVGNSIAVDAAGNVYTTGSFYGTVDFDPGPGTTNLTSAGFEDVFISKLDPTGIFLWAKRLGGLGHDKAYSIAVDAAGNVFTTGYFTGTADFDPGLPNYTLTSNGAQDVFISKLDVSGNFAWAKAVGGIDDEYVYSLALDLTSNVYVTGSFKSTVDFDPGTGTTNVTSNGDYDMFILKLDQLGNFSWAKGVGGLGTDYGNYITLNSSGNIWITGGFTGTTDFDPGTGTSYMNSQGNFDVFILKLDATGNFVWAKTLGGSDNEQGFSIAVDGTGNVYTTGYFNFTVDFDPNGGTYNMTSNTNDDVFILKLDPAGNFAWAKRIGGSGYDKGFSIAVDNTGNVYTTGAFAGTVDFDPGAGTVNLTSMGDFDIFISKLDPLGNYVWAGSYGGAISDYGYGVTVNNTGNFYATGYFNGTVDFDPGAATSNLVSAGYTDIFVTKLLSAAGGVDNANNSFNEINIFPNPGNGEFNIKSSGAIDEIIITDLLGQTIYSAKPNENNFSLQLGTNGIYFVTITSDKQTTTRKILVQH